MMIYDYILNPSDIDSVEKIIQIIEEDTRHIERCLDAMPDYAARFNGIISQNEAIIMLIKKYLENQDKKQEELVNDIYNDFMKKANK